MYKMADSARQPQEPCEKPIYWPLEGDVVLGCAQNQPEGDRALNKKYTNEE